MNTGVRSHNNNAFICRLLHEDFLPNIDWDRYNKLFEVHYRIGDENGLSRIVVVTAINQYAVIHLIAFTHHVLEDKVNVSSIRRMKANEMITVR